MTRSLQMLRPSPALVVASLALFVALSGTGYAVSQLPAKSVGAQQLKNDAVTSAKVKDGSLRARDFRPGQLPAGSQGPMGPAGPAGISQSGGAWASRNPAYLIPTQDVEMFSLTQYADGSTGSLKLTKPSRLVLNGVVSLARSDPFAYVYCQFETRSGGQWDQAGLVQSFAGNDPPNYFSLPLSAVVDVNAATDDVRIMCRSESPTTEAYFRHGSFTVVVSDR